MANGKCEIGSANKAKIESNEKLIIRIEKEADRRDKIYIDNYQEIMHGIKSLHKQSEFRHEKIGERIEELKNQIAGHLTIKDFKEQVSLIKTSVATVVDTAKQLSATVKDNEKFIKNFKKTKKCIFSSIGKFLLQVAGSACIVYLTIKWGAQ